MTGICQKCHECVATVSWHYPCIWAEKISRGIKVDYIILKLLQSRLRAGDLSSGRERPLHRYQFVPYLDHLTSHLDIFLKRREEMDKVLGPTRWFFGDERPERGSLWNIFLRRTIMRWGCLRNLLLCWDWRGACSRIVQGRR